MMRMFLKLFLLLPLLLLLPTVCVVDANIVFVSFIEKLLSHMSISFDISGNAGAAVVKADTKPKAKPAEVKPAEEKPESDEEDESDDEDESEEDDDSEKGVSFCSCL